MWSRSPTAGSTTGATSDGRGCGLGAAARAACAAAALLGACAAAAQPGYPVKPIRIISPFAPGGGNDVLARTLASRLAEELGVPLVVENRPGANGIVGTEAAARAAPDGYTIVLIPSGHAVNASLHKKLPFHPIRDFSPISLVGSSALVLAVHPSLPVRSVRELVALARARPGELTYGSAGVGSSGHLAGALFETLTATRMVHVPYRGMGLAVPDVIGGQITLVFGTSLSTVPHVRSGKLRGLATTGARRSGALPELPTVAEAGVPGYEAGLWYGFAGPAGLPREVVRRLNAAIGAALGSAEIRSRLAAQGLEPQPTSAEEFARLLVTDLERWAKVVARARVRVE